MIRKILFAVVLIAVGLFGYTKVMARIGSGEPPQSLPAEQQADAIKVYKGERRMTLLRDGVVIGTYRIALGSNGDGDIRAARATRKRLRAHIS